MLTPLAAWSAGSGLFDEVLMPAYPTPLYVTVAILGSVAQILALAAWRFTDAGMVALRGFAAGFYLSAAAWFGIYYSPGLPIMAMAVFFVIGVLALAPYFAVIAGIVTVLDVLMRPANGRLATATAILVAVGIALPPAIFLGVEAVQTKEDSAFRAAIRGGASELDALRDEADSVLEELQRQANGRNDGRNRHVPRPEQRWFQRYPLTTDELGHLYFWLTDRRPEVFSPGRTEELSLIDSQLQVASDDPAGLAYVDWVMEFENPGAELAEARADLLLAPGSLPCDLTLWVHGREQHAAFGSTVATTQAYESVVRKQLDPALLTDRGAGRFSLRVFPVPGRGHAKVRVGFTIPDLASTAGTRRVLPRFLDRNFSVACDHLIQCDQSRSEVLTNLALPFAHQKVDAQPAPKVWARDREGQVVVQTREPSVAVEGPLLLVVDAAQSVADAAFDFDAVESWLRARRAPTHVLVATAKTTRHSVFGPGEHGLAEFLRRQNFVGGVDASRGLRRAISIVEKSGIRQVVWISGSQPFELDDYTYVVRRLYRDDAGARWDAVPCAPDNVLLQQLLDQGAIRAIPPAGSLVANLAAVLAPGAGRSLARADAPPDSTPRASDHVVRLWAAQAARELSERSASDAAALAAAHRIVTPWSGAVVLETAGQYASHGLDPDADSAVHRPLPGGPVPEPETVILFGVGMLILLLYVRRRG